MPTTLTFPPGMSSPVGTLQPSSQPQAATSPSCLVVAYITEREEADFFPPPVLNELRRTAPSLRVVRPADGPAGLVRCLSELKPEVLICGWSTPLLPTKLPGSLNYVCYLTGSVRNVVSREHITDGLKVTNWGSSISRTVAEAALLLILASLRRTSYWAIAMHTQGAWRSGAEGMSLFGRRVGIHGFGRVSRCLIRLLQPFEVEIKVLAPDADALTGRSHGFAPVATLEELFSGCEIVVEAAPLNLETAGIVKESHLRLLPPKGVFVNIGRGEIVDEAGLVRVAQEGNIRFGLDVFTNEVLASDHPLRGLSNVTLTPHIAGPTADRCRDAGEFAVANLQRYLHGQELEAVVTLEVYDRST